MKVIKPIDFVDATMLVSSTATELYSAWSSSTSYAKDARAIYQLHIYQSLTNTNLNNNPATSTLNWILVGPDNTHAMFDGQVSTDTTSTSPLVVRIKPGIVNSAAFLGLHGQTLNVKVYETHTGPVVYNKTINLDGTIINDWYMYFFEPFVQLGEVVLTDLPPYLNSEIEMTLTSGGSVAIGEWLVGTVYTLGPEGTEQGATVGIIDYSRKDTDEFGNTTFVQRAFSKRMNAQFLLPNETMNAVQRILADVRAVPSIYIGSESTNYAPLVVYGFYRDFTIDIAYPTKSWCRLEVEGLI